MKIGIGITTYNRPEHVKLCEAQIRKHTPHFDLYIYHDRERKGIAYGKNMCLYNLRHCDYIFLFDDDCFPVEDGWTDFFIGSGLNHCSYMSDAYEPTYYKDQAIGYKHSSGVFMFISKAVLETVGYYNPAYGLYGFEHAGYSHRVWKAGLAPYRFTGLQGTQKYLYSLDHQGVGAYRLKHARSISDEERARSVKRNDEVFWKETMSNQIRYDFAPAV